MKLFLHELRTEQLIFWRSREAAIFTFLLPIVFFLMFGAIYGHDTIDGVKGAAYLEAGMIGYGVAATAFAGLAITLVIRRESGVLKRIRATPLPPATYIASVLTSTLVVFAIQSVLIIVLGRVLYGVAFPARAFSLAIALLLGAATFAALGLAITAAVRSSEGSSAVINIVYLPMAIISGTFFSPHAYPAFLRGLADVLPLTYFVRLAQRIMLHGDEIWTQPGSVGAVVAWGVVGVAIAVRGFRWQPREG